MSKKLLFNSLKFIFAILVLMKIDGGSLCYGMQEYDLIRPIVPLHPCTKFHGLGRVEHCSLCAAENERAKPKALSGQNKKEKKAQPPSSED